MEIDSPSPPPATPPLTTFPPSYFPVLAEGSYTWHLSQVSALLSPEAREERIASPLFSIGGHTWFLNMIPRTAHFSVYLALAEFAPQTRGGVCVDLIFIASSPDGKRTHVKMTSHRFSQNSLLFNSGGEGGEIPDWGFQIFLSLKALTENIDNGPLSQDNAFCLTVKVRVVADNPAFVRSLHMQSLSDSYRFAKSRQSFGFVGLHNQGATCYMNSILQSLFLTNAFRKVTLQIPTQGAKPGDSIPLALQRIFYQLQFSDDPPNTNELTDSFGWDTYQAFTQHDVQEFLRALLDDLEGKMKKTPVEGAIERLFVSKVCQIVQCLNIEYESVRHDTLYDVQLPILGCKNLKESLDKYVAPEYLDGSNKYNAEGHGLQDAKMFSAFESLPPVLHLILMRYRYDVDLDETVKINDRFEFPSEIDMLPYLRDKSPQKNEDATYVLHSVLVHSGDLHGGHYCAFIRDPSDEDWFKFDDTKVSKVDTHEAIDDNYGEDPQAADPEVTESSPNEGEENLGKIGRTMSSRRTRRMVKKITNAYMLVYVRKRDVDTIMAPVAAEDYDPSIPQRLAEEAQQEHVREEQEKIEQLTTVVSYATLGDILGHRSSDLIPNPSNGSGFPNLRQLRIWKNDSQVWELKQAICEQLGVPQVDVWMCTDRKNRTVRPHTLLSPDDAYVHLFLDDCTFFLVLPPSSVTGDSLITFKLFTSEEEGLKILGPKVCKDADLIGELVKSFAASTKIPESEIVVFEEMSARKIVPLDPLATLAQAKLHSGDIIVISCVQVNVVEHYQRLYDQVQVMMVDLVSMEDDEQETDAFVMTLSRQDTIQAIYEKLADHVECPVDILKLTFANSRNEEPLNQKMDPQSSALFFERNLDSYSTRTIYYSVQDGSEKPKLRVIVMDSNLEVKGETMLRPDLLEVSDLFDRFENVLDEAFDGNTCQLWQVINGRLTMVHDGGALLAELNPSDTFYFCCIKEPSGRDKNKDEKECILYYVRKGVPGYAWVKPRETVAEVLKRVNATGAALYDGEELVMCLDPATDIYEVLTREEKKLLHFELLINNSKPFTSSNTIKFHK